MAGYPVESAVLTDNPLYRTGKMATVTCRESPVSSMSRPQARKYFKTVNKCLTKAWRAQLKKVGLPLTEPHVGFINGPEDVCGSPWPEAAALYCPDEYGYIVELDRNLLGYAGDLLWMNIAAHEFGPHVQNSTGILYAEWRHVSSGGLERTELQRRVELQVECLAGVFMSSAFASLGRPKSDVNELKDLLRRNGDETRSVRDHGKGKNTVAWFTRGFESRDPKSCNTWTSKPGKVA
ncbi:hypothetical protein GT755_19830 [Herbidospora sp. NEAU-GS84]|uniref:Uncharacterized protein n=1 Tax=Herbidospora solisilvae TaxID=2696284 RepID=A0A7C9N1S3_9ACTN|nr:neutral zinc metallopeptidase [Herbidospora solisilvae]NAS23930.1 hypothetical protein [Herbidospora solisilvae]